ncbi:hypothetical protein M426DRAFT_32526, partial [Hypoxylon sp. CI-4A]
VEDYAILSHRWLPTEDEVLFCDIESVGHKNVGEKKGYFKLSQCCEQAKRDGLKYVWIDSCCIDKTDSTEVQESINSMYRWYGNATKCYAYLKDTTKSTTDVLQLGEKEEWFTRGWTLQELVAPKNIQFFDTDWKLIGSKFSLGRYISKITGIRRSVLGADRLQRPQQHPQNCSVAERMSWAARRQTTREEDRAYSLLGLFDVNMPMLYGEGGDKAFLRLQEEIIKRFDDHSIFAW